MAWGVGCGVGGGDATYGGACIAAAAHVGAVGFRLVPFAGEAVPERVRIVG